MAPGKAQLPNADIAAEVKFILVGVVSPMYAFMQDTLWEVRFMRRAIFLLAVLSLAGVTVLLADTAETIPFLTTLMPSNETPPINDTSVGNVIVWVHVIRDAAGNITSGSVDFDVACKFSGAVTVSGLHIHKAPAGTAGGIVIPTDVNGTDKSIAIDASGVSKVLKQVQFPQATLNPPLDAALIQDLLNNPQSYYANIHTTDHPGGAMRGQLLKADMKVVMGLMNANNEVPPTGVSATGVATVTVLRALDGSGNVAQAEAIFNLEYTGFDAGTTFTGFHIHNGPAGANAGVIINTGIGSGAASVAADPSGAGNLNYEVPMTPLDGDAKFVSEAATVNGLFTNPNGYYINIHSTVFGGGVIRDQLKNTDKNVFQVTMLPSNETPPITGLNASAITDVPIYTLRNADGSIAAGTIIFDGNFRGFPAATAITGFHIHKAPAGQSGGIVFFSGVNNAATGFTSDTGNGNIFRIVTIATPDGIAALNTLVQDPSQFYVNIHTSVNAGGAARAQLAGPPAKPTPSGVAATASTITSAAPGSILSVYGTSLANYTSDLSAFYLLTALPTSVNGVTATIAGVKAPFYYVSPAQLNIQVPFEVTPGTQPLVVTTAGGASNTMNITVASAAPSIFFDAPSKIAAIVKNSDFSVITSDNPAKVGEVIVIYSTGLGQTSPALTTGALAPANPLDNTTTVSVTIGSQAATPIYSIASPGFAGLYQTAVTIPSGVSGNAAVVLKSGTASSNTVTIAVQ